MKTLSEQKRYIEQEIKETRAKINSPFDKIQNDIMRTLNTDEEKERRDICMSLTSLDGKGTDICEYQRKIVKLKQHATGLQTFLFLKQLEIEVSYKN